MPASVRAKYWAKENLVKTSYPMMNSVATQVMNIKGNDKPYDADFGGYKNGDYIDTNWTRGEKHKRYQRYAANNLSPKNKALNTFVSIGLQNMNELSAKEKARLQKEKYKRFIQRQNNK